MKVFTVMDIRTAEIFGTFATEKEALSFVNDMIATDFTIFTTFKSDDTEKGLIWTKMVLVEQELNHGEEDGGYVMDQIFWDEKDCVPVV